MMLSRGDGAALVATLALATVGGVAASALHLPLGYMLGAIVLVGLVAGLGLQVGGRGVFLPQPLRMGFVPVIGVVIGAGFTPEMAGQALGWWVSLAALLVYVPVAHVVGYAIYRAGGLDPKTAFFSAVPGGLIESIELAEAAGANVAMTTSLHFLRLIGIILCVPVIFTILTGASVGSASGVQMTGSDVPLTLWDAVVLALSGIVGWYAGKVVRLPAYFLTGPLIASAVAHGMGWVHGVPPDWLVAVTQVVVGGGLGAKFAGVGHAMLRRALGLSVLYGAAVLALAFVFAWAVQALGVAPVTAAFLAFAPGGVAEMSLIALSLQYSVVFVTVHHVARILIAVLVAKFGYRLLKA
jgi:membrane AbrB-like protein